MGGNSSKKDDSDSIGNYKNNESSEKRTVSGNVHQIPISDEQVRLVRDSWKELTKLEDFKIHGTNMMIK